MNKEDLYLATIILDALNHLQHRHYYGFRRISEGIGIPYLRAFQLLKVAGIKLHGRYKDKGRGYS